MQKDIQAEVILCPNCNEDVPKTLYCLNCGYPLYKVEQEWNKPEAEVMGDEAAPEVIELTPISEAETDAEASSTIVDVQVPVEPINVDEEAEEPQLTSAEEAVETELPEAEEVEGEMEVELDVGIQEAVEEEAGTLEEVSEVTEAEVEVLEEEEEIEEPVEEVTAEEEPSEETQEIPIDFEPDPLTTMVMENLAKNISVKVKLISLLSEGNVKEATFNRLFESYAARGERWANKRNEMLERSRYNLDAMEKTLAEAKMNLEELEIRKAIGDASEEEYRAKTPAFNWDINALEDELRHRKGEIAYLEDLTRVMSLEEMEELKEIAESSHASLDNLVEEGRISSETVTRVKASLEEIINHIESPESD